MADCKRKTANLFDLASWIIANGSTYTKDGESYTFETKLSMHNSPYYFSETDIPVSISGILENISSVSARIDFLHADGTVSSGNVITDTKVKSENLYAAGLRFDWSTGGTITLSKIMLNTGSTALPYEPYWLHSLRKLTTATDTITTLPANIYADGTNATVGLKGNMSQTGTPTPQNPIQPQECGDRTGNLFDGDNWYGTYKVSTGVYSGTVNNFYVINCKPFKVDDVGKTFTFRMKMTNVTSINVRVRFTSEGVEIKGNNLSADGYSSVSFTVSSTDDSVGVSYGSGGGNAITFSEIMLNTGSTAKPYEPYGYKIPISSANTTTPVYLGEVESTRKIKKLVLTGEENIGFSGIPYYSVSDISRFSRIICSHFIFTTKNVKTELVNGECTTYVGAGYAIWFKLDNITNANDFKTYLQQQYANDTPVTVWYVLATETTGIINEPLRKIGDYADTVSGISIPTITGKDTFDVDTSLKPSEVSLAYTGWHDSSAKEWDGSQWQ